MKIKVQLSSGQILFERYINSFPIIIGRTDPSDLIIEHNLISRRHAEMRWDGTKISVTDLKSRNGIYVNNEKVETATMPAPCTFNLSKEVIVEITLEDIPK